MIQFEAVNKTFPGGVKALSGVNLTIEKGDFVAVVGLSGAGKSTLLRAVNGLVRPESGRVLVDGSDVAAMAGKELRRLRRRIGLIFQDYNLVDQSPVLTNVLAGRLGYNSGWGSLVGKFPPQDVDLAKRCLAQVELTDKTYERAGNLSGGQKQRVSIARALAQEPAIILADEPVASLDPPTAHDIMQYFKRINRQQGITILINLHDINLACQYARRIIGMRQGQIVHDGPSDSVCSETFSEIYGRSPHPAEIEAGHAAS
ncbi:MAG: phosphonate ABC transporter ATP-binding protein [Firmicutes bacterium]|nr:phosphonate ABC transporter ATP-binding protein [Bacillota bacterium]